MTKGADNCASFDALLVEYAYGELKGAARLELEAHLEECGVCRAALGAIGATRRAMQTLAPESVPEAGLESLLDCAQRAAARSAAPRRSPWRWLVPAMSAGSLGLVLAIVLANGREPSESALPAAGAPRLAQARSGAQPAPAPATEGEPKDVGADQAFGGVDALDARVAKPHAERTPGAMGSGRPREKNAAAFKGEASYRREPGAAHRGRADAPAQEQPTASTAFGRALALPAAPAASPAGEAAAPATAPPPAVKESERAEASRQAKRDEATAEFDDAREAAPRKSRLAARPKAELLAAEAGAADADSAVGLEEALVRARAASVLGDFGSAAAILAFGLAEHPGDRRVADALWALAEAYERAGDPARAEAAYARFLALFPGDSRASPAAANRARLREQTGDAPNASQMSDEAAPAAPIPAGARPQRPTVDP